MVDTQKAIHDRLGLQDSLDRIVKDTVPGDDNDPIIDGLEMAGPVVDEFNEDTNNWFEILDVRIYDRRVIGIPARYRWSILRWVANDMDEWLYDHGWSNIAHLKADSRLRNRDEMEARYRKEYMGVTVYANFLVHFPDTVLDQMSGDGKSATIKAKEKLSVEERKAEFINELRG